MGVTSSEDTSKREIHYPGKRITDLRQAITAKNIRRGEAGPKLRKPPGSQGEIVATGGSGTTVNCSGGGASYYGKGVALGLNPLDFADALENTGLISAASTSACHHQANHFSTSYYYLPPRDLPAALLAHGGTHGD